MAEFAKKMAAIAALLAVFALATPAQAATVTWQHASGSYTRNGVFGPSKVITVRGGTHFSATVSCNAKVAPSRRWVAIYVYSRDLGTLWRKWITSARSASRTWKWFPIKDAQEVTIVYHHCIGVGRYWR